MASKIPLLMAISFMVLVDLLLMSSQFAIEEIALLSGEEQYTELFTYTGSYISNYGTNYTINEDLSGQLPGGESDVDEGDSNPFVDIFYSFRNWLLDVSSGASYLINVINAFPNFLKGIGLPTPLSFALGVLWHSTTLVMFIMFLRGNY